MAGTLMADQAGRLAHLLSWCGHSFDSWRRVDGRRPDEPEEWLPAAGVGHPGRDDRARDPETARRLLLPRLAARATQTSRTSTDVGCRDLISAGRVDPADGEAGRTARHHPAVEVAGQRDGERPRRPG